MSRAARRAARLLEACRTDPAAAVAVARGLSPRAGLALSSWWYWHQTAEDCRARLAQSARPYLRDRRDRQISEAILSDAAEGMADAERRLIAALGAL